MSMTIVERAASVPTSADVDGAAAARFADELGFRRLRPLTVVIAAYNEETAIEAVLRQIPQQVCGLRVDTLVVVDGATDATAAAARRAGVLVCDVPVNRGQGAALRLGYRLARAHGARYIATLDADGQYDPAQLSAVLEPLVAGTADFVTGSRRLGAAHTTDQFRAAGVVVYGALISLLTGQRITDPTNGLRAMRAEVTAGVVLRQPQYQATELLIGAALRGFRVVEVPVVMYRRRAGTTKKGGNLRYGARVGRVILGTWRRERGSRPLPTAAPDGASGYRLDELPAPERMAG
jgi:glycosyltransferase involved in cell wall biosynthesis